MSGLFVKRVGDGPRVVLVHGAVWFGEVAWQQQLPLADRWRLEIVDRVGYGRSDFLGEGEDGLADADLLADLLVGGAHLVAHSSGAAAALLAAARRPADVLSLTLSEPPVFQVAADAPEARLLADRLADLFTDTSSPDAAWIGAFAEIIGSGGGAVANLPPVDPRGVRTVRAAERVPWHFDLPLDQVATGAYPKLVISGNHHPAFERVCDALAEKIGARRAHVEGAGHSTPVAGDPFNKVVDEFLRSASVES